jgi:hypothetical protein
MQAHVVVNYVDLGYHIEAIFLNKAQAEIHMDSLVNRDYQFQRKFYSDEHARKIAVSAYEIITEEVQ